MLFGGGVAYFEAQRPCHICVLLFVRAADLLAPDSLEGKSREKRNIARRSGTSVAAAALSFALVAPLAQPVAGAQEATPGEVENQPTDGAANPESPETGTPNESDPDADWGGGGDGPREESPRGSRQGRQPDQGC